MSQTPHIMSKRIYDDPAKSDGYRVLVDRIWPRGIKKADAELDDWNKKVGPTKELRQWFHEDTDGRFEEFRKRYTAELEDSDGAEALAKELAEKPEATLLTASKDLEHCHIPVLIDWLEK